MEVRRGKLSIRARTLMSIGLFALLVISSISIIPIVLTQEGPVFIEEMVEMRDGVRLYTRIYLPDPSISPQPYPAILYRTPYGIGTPGEQPTVWPSEVFNGYAYVTQDTRGRFYSEGVDRFFYDDGLDGYDTIEWIASQGWCNGKVGMWGYSAPGITTFLAAGENPPHLEAIIPLASSGNVMNDLTFVGGAFRGDALIWGLGQTLWGLSDVPNGHLETVVPQAQQELIPQYLEDVDGVLTDLGMHLLWHDPTTPYPGWPFLPKATESEWWMHLPLVDYHPSLAALQPYMNEIISHPDEDEWRDHYKVYDTIDVPTLLACGCYDFFAKCQVDAFVALHSRGVPVKILVGNGTHGNPGLPYSEFTEVEFEWFDYWLKGEDTGVMDEPPVLYYSLEADEWKSADQWPPKGVKYTNYYLHDDGVLSTDPCAAGEVSESYVYDPMDPVLTMGGTNEPGGGAIKAGSFDQRPVVFRDYPTMSVRRDDILSYTTPPLTEDVEIAGPLKVVLSASSNCLDTDFTAKLIDVHPTGELMLVADGIIRARYRNSMATPELMTPGEVYEFTIDIGHIAQVFKANHSIRVDISSSNFPKHDRNLNTGGELYKETEMLVAENTIYHDSEHQSYIALPIVGTAVLGDLNNDGIVDIFDVVTVSIAFGSQPGDTNWDAIADLNNDGIVDIFDVVTVTANFGNTA